MSNYYWHAENESIRSTHESVEVDTSWEQIPEPPTDAQIKGGSVKYKWDDTNEDYVEVVTPPSPQEAYDQIEQLLIDAYTTAGAEKPYIDAMRLIDKYPSVERQIERGNYGVSIEYIDTEIMEKEDIVTAEMVDEIKSILNPKGDKS